MKFFLKLGLEDLTTCQAKLLLLQIVELFSKLRLKTPSHPLNFALTNALLPPNSEFFFAKLSSSSEKK